MTIKFHLQKSEHQKVLFYEGGVIKANYGF